MGCRLLRGWDRALAGLSAAVRRQVPVRVVRSPVVRAGPAAPRLLPDLGLPVALCLSAVTRFSATGGLSGTGRPLATP